MFETFEVLQSEHAGMPAVDIQKKGSAPNRQILYLYGSFYLFGIESMHWKLVSELLTRADIRITVPAYPLAPEYNWEDVYAALMPLYEHVTGSAPEGGLTLMGDFDGGGIAAGLCLEASELGLPTADQLVLLCPWLDAGLTNRRIADLVESDPWLSVDSAREAARLYAAGNDLKDYRISPIYGNLEKLPPTRIFTATRDILHPDCLSFADLADACGAEIELIVEQELFHNWMMFDVPEARHTLDQIVTGLPEQGKGGT
ncbi:alpha/beta hydrolase fold domain-containing protein [Hoeflea prorocentri]|uniref:Alpha/beta hydrolase fold domain-containing protein n=1 Tax=Hoeflea prorocentri TaxID=1922333 RepID=A0A9X3UH12_9HYPH|nr:alpha/beta hydrolase fold domain-containing protein [Hoeflea prorocentri]MCY6380315.1 alpha/beta hydrolase fold domain-containing protein [Hoeflea prorocentri]MDA5398115.1 alpha/beta hydrolase fold domain-containing protein [Hoeflea prorocentri]